MKKNFFGGVVEGFGFFVFKYKSCEIVIGFECDLL